MRNFWITGQIDGRSTNLEGGPRAKDGGFEVIVYVRDEGESVRAVTVHGWAKDDGTLVVSVKAKGHEEVEVRTNR